MLRLLVTAYATNRKLLADGAGRRLENFFWRLWGSDHIMKNITRGQVAILFDSISEDGPLRTTPTQSPRASRMLGNHGRESHPSQSQQPASEVGDKSNRNIVIIDPAESLPQPPHVQVEAANCQDDQRVTAGQRATYTLQLAQGSGASSNDHTLPEVPRTKIVSEGGEDESTPTPTPPPTARRVKPSQSSIGAYRQPEEPPNPEILRDDGETLPPGSLTSLTTVVSASSEDTVKGGLGGRHRAPKRTTRKRGVYYASTPTSRRRPVVMRRKSSQSSSSTASSTVSPRPSTSGARTLRNIPVIEHEAEHGGSARTSEDAIEDDESPPAETREIEWSSTATDPRSVQQRNTLVEPDFRSKFVAKTRSAQSSFVSLPSLLRKPSATPATPASYQATGTLNLGQETEAGGRGRGRVSFPDEAMPLATPRFGGPRPGQEEHQTTALQRTQSQLTLLLERERDRGAGSQDPVSKPQEKPSR